MDDHNDTPTRRRPWLLLALLLTCAAYVPSLGGDFTYDDRFIAMAHDGDHHNPMVAELRPLGDYFTSHYWRGTTEHSRLFRPVTILTYALRHHVVGDNAAVAHAINLLLHVLATALVFGLVRGLQTPHGLASLSALVFGLHAIHSEAVLAVSGRAELLAFCGGASALLLLLRARTASRTMKLPCWLAAAVCLFTALGAKESALAWVPFAACYGLARWWGCRGRLSLAQPTLLAEVIVLGVPTAAYLWLRGDMLAQLPADITWSAEYTVNPIFDAEVTVRLLTGSMVWAFGLLHTCLPLWPAADWGAAVFPIPDGLGDPAALLGIAGAGALLALLIVGLASCRQRPEVFLAATCFLGFGLATSNLLFPIGTLFAERLYYTPSLALSFGLCWLAKRVVGRGTTVPLLLLGLWLGANFLVITQRTEIWRDNEALILHEATHQPRSVRMQLHAALLHGNKNHPIAAVRHLEQLVELDPGHVHAWSYLGDLYRVLGHDERAAIAYGTALHGRRAELIGRESAVRGKLAVLLKKLGEPRRALTQLTACFLLDPAHCRSRPELAALAAALATATGQPEGVLTEATRLRDQLTAPAAAGR